MSDIDRTRPFGFIKKEPGSVVIKGVALQTEQTGDNSQGYSSRDDEFPPGAPFFSRKFLFSLSSFSVSLTIMDLLLR